MEQDAYKKSTQYIWILFWFTSFLDKCCDLFEIFGSISFLGIHITKYGKWFLLDTTESYAIHIPHELYMKCYFVHPWSSSTCSYDSCSLSFEETDGFSIFIFKCKTWHKITVHPVFHDSWHIAPPCREHQYDLICPEYLFLHGISNWVVIKFLDIFECKICLL